MRTVLITGSTDGHGRQVALDLAARGWTVLLHGRDRPRSEQVLREALEAGAGEGTAFLPADLSSLAAVRGLAEDALGRTRTLDALVNNAGITTRDRQESADGIELTFAVNYLAHVALTEALLDALRAAAPARVVNVASAAQAPLDDPMLERGWSAMRAYAQSKLAQVMWTIDMAERLDPREVTINALHPATLMDTTMVRRSFGRAHTSVREGAAATERLVLDRALEGVTGRYFEGRREARPAAGAHDAAARRRLAELTEELLRR